MIKAIIFDCWGTLFFREDKITTSAVAKMLGQEYDDSFRARYQQIIDTNMNDYRSNAIRLAKEFCKKPDDGLIDNLISFLNVPIEKIFPFPGTIQTLKHLKRGYKLGLLTNVQYHTYLKLNEKYFVESLFSATVKSFELGKIKPDKIMFQKILERLGENRDTVLMVGNDFKQDVRAAEHLGMMAVLLDRDGKYPDFEKRITSLAELPKFLH